MPRSTGAAVSADTRNAVAADGVRLSPMDTRIEPRRVTRSRALGAIGGLLLAGTSVYAYMESGLGRTAQAPTDRLTIAQVSFDTFREYIPLTGNVVPRTTVYLDAIDGGQVAAVHVEEGEVVKAGQALLMLKNSHLHLQVIAAEAQLAEQVNVLSQTTLTAEQSRLRNRRELIEIDFEIDRLGRELDRRKP